MARGARLRERHEELGLSITMRTLFTNYDLPGDTLSRRRQVKLTEDDIGIPFYPGAKAAHSGKLMQTGEEEGEFVQVAFTTPDSVDKVKAFYQEKLAGVKTPMEISTAESRMVQMVAEDGDTQKSVVITRGKDDKETQIGLTRVTKSE